MVPGTPRKSLINSVRQYPFAMGVEKLEVAAKGDKTSKSAKKVKKNPVKRAAPKDVQQKLDFSKWLEMFATGVQADKLQPAVLKVSSEFQNLASELMLATSNAESKPTSKLKLEKLPSEFLKTLRGKITNPYYAIALLCHSATDLELKKVLITDLNKFAPTNDDVEYLLNKMNAIKDSHIQEVIWNEFLSSGILTSDGWSGYQLKILDWGFSHSFSLNNPIATLIGFRAASDQFKSLETPQRNRTYRKLLELDVFIFIVFILHIARESISEKFIEQIIAKKNNDVLLVFLENRHSLTGPWLENFEKEFISPLLKTSLDAVMRFEDLLPFLMRQSLFSHLLPAETLTRAVARSFKRNDEFSELLSDTRVALLENNVKVLSDENSKILVELAAEKTRSQEQERKIREFETAIENYESRLRSQMHSENLGSDAMSQNSKIEVLKSIVEGIDHLLQGSDGFQLERALQKVGVTRLGEPGADFSWDSEVCETLTGESMASGIVVRSGYTWFNAGKKLVIRRVLLKTK